MAKIKTNKDWRKQVKLNGVVNVLGKDNVKVCVDHEANLSIGCPHSTLKDKGLHCQQGGERCIHFRSFEPDRWRDMAQRPDLRHFGNIRCGCPEWEPLRNVNRFYVRNLLA